MLAERGRDGRETQVLYERGAEMRQHTRHRVEGCQTGLRLDQNLYSSDSGIWNLNFVSFATSFEYE